ncbi:MAG: PD40 domain-containing protein [Chloroflexota bacterium]|nr:PD40 domain-containing protein [Chloroflexota bacterium]
MTHPRLFVLSLAAAAFAFLTSSQAFSTPISASAFESPAVSAIRAANAPVAPLVPTGRLIVSADSGGAWAIYTADPNGSAWQPVSANAVGARDPAVSPDGKTIAFRSNREGTWEIYSMLSDGSAATRLTRGTIYSGAPVWSPDGKKIAFESYARGDLDIWVMHADGTQPIDLTDDSKAYDYAPAWSPDGKWIAFTSWRTGTQQVFAVAADCAATCTAFNLSQNKFDDQAPAWSPDGKKIAFVSDRDGQRAIYVADFSILGLKNIRRLTFSGWDDQPAWSPDGNWIAFVSARPTRTPIYIVPALGGVPRLVENGPAYASSVAWAQDSTAAASSAANELSTYSAPLYKEQPDLAPASSGHPYEMRRMTTTHLDPGINKLNSLVADSFVALQARVKQQVGYDFLGILSDMTRPVDIRCDITCDTLSWHKAGRAWDSRLDYSDPRGIGGLEIVREDQQGETFWRVYLRAAAQDGTMGEPLKEAPWDLSYRARWIVARGEGGTKKPLPYGFYVDFTEEARQYGWERISSHDDQDFDWRTNKLGAEYWHFQQTDGLNWYQAMREVYSESDVKAVGDWNSLASQSGYDPYLLYLKGIPEPPKAWRWNMLGP